MNFIDTNIFIRYFTGDDAQKGQKSLELLQRISENKESASTSALVVFEIIFTLEKQYKISKNEIKDLILPILNIKNLKLADKEIFYHALNIYTEKNISFGDAYNAAFMRKKKIKKIYSYDKDFNKLDDIKRIEP